jgi:hypothetical protein
LQNLNNQELHIGWGLLVGQVMQPGRVCQQRQLSVLHMNYKFRHQGQDFDKKEYCKVPALTILQVVWLGVVVGDVVGVGRVGGTVEGLIVVQVY